MLTPDKEASPCYTQLQMRFNLSFMVPANPDMIHLDTWLSEVFELSPPEQNTGNQGSCVETARQWLQRCLLLSKELMQAGRMPIFSAAQIISCFAKEQKSDDGTLWQAVISLPRLENIHLSSYTLAFNTSFRLCRQLATSAITDEQLHSVFNLLQQQVIKPLQRIVTAGKSTIPLLRAAYDKGIPIIHLGLGVYQLGWGCKARHFDRSTSDRDSALGVKLAQNKVVCARLLRQAGFPCPEHELVDNLAAANNAAQKLGWPVVTKPSSLDRGEGVSVDIVDATTLAQGINYAQQAGKNKNVLVERQVDGYCHRLFIVDETLLYGIKRMPLSICADGIHSIAEIIAIEKKQRQKQPPWKRTSPVQLDDLARAALARAGYHEESIPPAGVNIELRRIESTQWGGTFEDVTGHIHPANIGIALDAAKLFNLQIAGIDIITTDISLPWYENGAIINEVNFSPLLGGNELSRHYLPQYLRQLVPNQGRIPVELFVGNNNAWQAGVERLQQLTASGIAAYLTGATKTLKPDGTELVIPLNNTYQRTRALLLRRDVAALILVIQPGEFDLTGMPVEHIDSITTLA